jgi:hypothetical protein
MTQEDSLCKFFTLLDDIGLSPYHMQVARSANELLVWGHVGEGVIQKVSAMWPIHFH